MKRFFLFSLLLLAAIPAIAQDDNIIYSFKTKHHKKVELIFNDDSVFICRFYSWNRLKFELRDNLTDTDTIFRVHGYHRGGGAENAAMDYNDVTFRYGDCGYDIYYVWGVDEEDPDADKPGIYGIQISCVDDKHSDLRGVKVLEGEVYGWSFYDILPEAKE
jgi:hypothetical protein